MTDQTHRHFHDQLDQVKVRLLAMSAEAESAVGLAVEALLSRDPVKAEAVIEGDKEIDRLEMEIEDDCIGLIALQQPMARDLRILIAALKIANDLERVGDHAVNIAESAERLTTARAVTPEPELIEMARIARTMLADALEAYVRGDAQLGREVCRRDDEVDALHRAEFRNLITHMTKDQSLIEPALGLLLVSRNLERIADLATNVAEEVVFLVEGKSIKHRVEGVPDSP